MAGAERPRVLSIPPHVGFVDALAAGLLADAGDDRLKLARTRVLLPTRRAVRALTEAFVRVSGGGLLLPRMTPVGDLDDAGHGFDAPDLPPALDACERRLRFAELVRRGGVARGDTVTAVEALRLGDALAKALDTLTAEEIPADALEHLDLRDGLAGHFETTLDQFRAVRSLWPQVLAASGASDAQARANAALDALATRWAAAPPGPVVAAGMVGAAPPLARLLGIVARLPHGQVVLPGIDLAMPDDEWDALADGGEAHPQFALRQLLDRMGVGRAEVAAWPGTDTASPRTTAVARAMSRADFTGDWRDPPPPGAFAGVRRLEAATPEEEAQAVALALREALETPGRTAALVTPDRGLARRVAAHLARWDIAIDDSAGQSLSRTPPGAFVLALVEAAAHGFAPVALLAALKHPLVRRGEERLPWLDSVRALDKALRGVRPAPGLAGIAARLTEVDAPPALVAWWDDAAALLTPLATLFAGPALSLATLAAMLRDTGESLAGDELWRGPAGRALAEVVAALTAHGDCLASFDADDAPPLLAAFLNDKAVREAFDKHPRLAIYGTLEARLQRRDLMILGGLNEGIWPATPAPDPWLAPAVRSALGLGGRERASGLAAHDFVEALGNPQVLLTRARRDDGSPTVASRLWLRLTALAGEAIAPADDLLAMARGLDRPARVVPATRPAPAPLAALRPRKISVTAVEKLRADPFSYYAQAMLRLRVLAPLDEDPSAAERGTDVHRVLQTWTERGGEPSDLQPIAAEMLRSKWANHPLLRALWAPRVARMLDWVVATSDAWAGEGWTPRLAEARGTLDRPGGVVLDGRADRLDRRGDGALAIIDYKTGTVPSRAAIAGGFALQMGLLGAIAQTGGFGERGAVAALRYWKLGGGKDPGKVSDVLKVAGGSLAAADHIADALATFDALAADYLRGDAPFEAKRHPDYASRYSDFDQLARVAEWLGRPAVAA